MVSQIVKCKGQIFNLVLANILILHTILNCICSDDVFSKLIDTVMPVIESVQCDIKILVPPLPPYLFAGCCDSPLHCVNVRESAHAESLLSATSRMRALLKRKLADLVPGTTWVMESCSVLLESADMTVPEKLSKLRTVYGTDGVHLRPEGTENLAKNINGTIKKFEQGIVGRIPYENRSAAVYIPRFGTYIRYFLLYPVNTSIYLCTTIRKRNINNNKKHVERGI